MKFLMPDKKILIPPGGQLVHCLAGHTQLVTCLDMTSDGRYVATGMGIFKLRTQERHSHFW